MNYQKHYNLLIERAQSRNLTDYVEKHHIIPKALGGTDDDFNIVELTPREHFIAHLLLSKIYGGKMKYALYMMSTRTGYTNRIYGKLKEEFSISLSENLERAQKISSSLSMYKKTEEHIRNWVNSRKKNNTFIVTEEHKKKISKALSGENNPMFNKTHSDNARKLISEANNKSVICPHCGKSGGIAIMPRWHFDRCKKRVL